MSLYQFFASEKPLFVYDSKVVGCERKSKSAKIAEKSECVNTAELEMLKAIRIGHLGDLHYARMFTDMPYCADIEWHYNDQDAELILKYIQQYVETKRKIELWNTWMDYKAEVTYKSCSVEALAIQDIQEIWGKPYFEHHEYLKIYRQF